MSHPMLSSLRRWRFLLAPTSSGITRYSMTSRTRKTSRPWRSHFGTIDRQERDEADFGPVVGVHPPMFSAQGAPTTRGQQGDPSSGPACRVSAARPTGTAAHAGPGNRSDLGIGVPRDGPSDRRRSGIMGGCQTTPSNPTDDTLAITDRTTLRRKKERGSYDRDVVHAILDEGLAVPRRLQRRRLDLRDPDGVRPDGRHALSPRRHRQPHASTSGRRSRGVCHRDAPRRAGPGPVGLPPLDELPLRHAVRHGPRVDDDDEKLRATMALLEHIAPGSERRHPTPDGRGAAGRAHGPDPDRAKARPRSARAGRSTNPRTWGRRSGPGRSRCRSPPVPPSPTGSCRRAPRRPPTCVAYPVRGAGRASPSVPTPMGTAPIRWSSPARDGAAIATDPGARSSWSWLRRLLVCVHVVGFRRPIVADGGGADSIPVRVGLSHSSGVT